KSIPLFFLLTALAAAAVTGHGKLVVPTADGKLKYTPDANGNTIPDFSNCGYMGGGVALPEAPVKATVNFELNSSKDDTARIQAAIDDVAKLPLDQSGLRGAVLLKRGTYHICTQLKI